MDLRSDSTALVESPSPPQTNRNNIYRNGIFLSRWLSKMRWPKQHFGSTVKVLDREHKFKTVRWIFWSTWEERSHSTKPKIPIVLLINIKLGVGRSRRENYPKFRIYQSLCAMLRGRQNRISPRPKSHFPPKLKKNIFWKAMSIGSDIVFLVSVIMASWTPRGKGTW